MADFGSLSQKRSTNAFDSVEVAPHQRNFGTLTNQKRPTINKLVSSVFTKSPPFQSHDSGLVVSGSGDDIDRGSVKLSLSVKRKHHGADGTHSPSSGSANAKKFGTFDGVLARCLLCIWGVIMYLRTSWIVGHAGILETTIIMCLASSVTTFTSLSLSAICTNGTVKAGGYYFLISRSLGPEFGGVIGILFAFANCISVSMYLTGFAETIVSLYDEEITGGWDIQLWAELVLIFLLLVSLRGVGGVIKFDMVLLVVLIISLIIFFLGTFINKADKSLLFTGYSGDTFATNWKSNYKDGESFISVFSVFFPAVTGEMAGANISGDLKNPSHSIPVGTMAAVFISTIVYVAIAWILGATVGRGDSSCNVNKGLYCDYMVMSKISLWSPLVIAGIFASTLSSGLSCFVGAPRIFQAVCQDNLFPQLSYFAKARESDGEPVRAYAVGFVISFVAILSGNINFIAPIITNFFLITYALMNYSCFAWSLTKSPGWRPTFKYYHPWVSLLASAECIVLMFLIDWIMALITVVIGLVMYKYVSYIEPQVHWGTAAEAMTYMTTCKNLLKYQAIKPHAKVERPTFLLFNINKEEVEEMFDFATILNYAQGLIMIGDVVVGDRKDPKVVNKFIVRRRDHLWDGLNEEIAKQSVVETCIASTFVEGMSILLQTAGVGGIRPNVVLLKMLDKYEKSKIKKQSSTGTNEKNNHESEPVKETEFMGNGQDTVNTTIGVSSVVPIVDEAVDAPVNNDSDGNNDAMPLKGTNNEDEIGVIHKNSDGEDDLSIIGSAPAPDNSPPCQEQPDWMEGLHSALTTGCGVVMVKGNINWTKAREDGSFIDIWWLYDDGGLTVLIPYLLQKSKEWENCQLRIMALENVGLSDQQELISLMAKLRINAEVVNVKSDVAGKSISQIDRNNLGFDVTIEPNTLQNVLRGAPINEGDNEENSDDSDNKTNAERVESPLALNDSKDKKQKSANNNEMTDATTSATSSQGNPFGSLGRKKTLGVFTSTEEISSEIDKEYGDSISLFAKKKLVKYKKLGKLIEQSRTSELCIVTMPFPRAEYSWFEYTKIIEALSPQDMPMVFVRGNQSQVLTFAL